MRRAGIQTEILLSLALVMVLAVVVVAGVFAVHQERSLQRLLGRALLAEARTPQPLAGVLEADVAWWSLDAAGAAHRLRGAGGRLDAPSRALAREASQRGLPLLRAGAPWEPIRFAAPGPGGEVRVARVPAEVSRRLRLTPLLVLAGVLVADAAVFTALGAALLRRRVVEPLRRVGEAARCVAEGAEGLRLAEEGARETAELARSFNEMTASLEARREALVKVVAELRESNTDLRRARAGLDRAERLAAVGELAAGVAHEVGNPIGAMLAFMDLAGRDPGLGEAGRAHLARAAREGERVRRILRQLLDFSRPPRGEPAALDLVAAAEEARALVAAQRRYAGVELSLEAAQGPAQAFADPGAVAQILLNLLLNAADAASAAARPRVSIRVRGTEPAHRAGRSRDDAPQVACEISDNGPGVPEEARERIFLPFVTRKPPGEGTGLGLPNALRLAEEQGGGVDLAEAGPEGGARFVLRLPAAGGAAEAPPLGARDGDAPGHP